ncbi:hypothetical protein BD410DRAFT_57574 [Rickenella mellea]|uniref:Uncharacterized protein n=1 Tax=Rickenella mellea TaxID=50990 RepID=A0A4Y7QAJ9_9AGAM|nr:hypothetical protein BD410DRAFT_57574 [Rickenella mellea]
MSEKPTPTRTTIPPKYLSDFSKALASEVQILLREVLVLGDERRALQYEVEKYKAAKAKIVAENKPKAEDFKAEPAWRVVELSPEKRKQFEKLKPKATTEVPQATGTANTSENANGTIVPSTSKAALKPDFPSWIPWKPLRQKGTPPKSLPAPESTPLLQGPPPQAPSPPAESPPPPLPAPKPVRAPMRSDSWATWQPDPKFAPTPPPPESPPPALRAPRSVRAEPVRSDSWATWRPDPNLAPTPPPPESSLPTGLFGDLLIRHMN